MLKRRILFAMHGPSAWGDINALAYNLHQRLRAEAVEVVLVQLLTDADSFFFRQTLGEDFENPRGLDGVRSCRAEDPILQQQDTLAALIDSFAPDLLVGWGNTPARVLKRAAPTVPLVLMVSRCDRLERLIEGAAVRDFVGFSAAAVRGVAYRVHDDDPELDALRACDLAVLPSSLAQFVHRHLFPACTAKMYARPLALADLVYDEAESFADLRRPFAARDVDVLFAAPEWQTCARNFAAVEKICARLRHLNVHLAGELDGTELHAEVHGLLPSRRAFFDLLGRSKVAVFPGLVEPAPAGMFAASAMGCNVVASSDCGYWELCHDDLCVTVPSVAQLLDRIERALPQPLPDQRGRFPGHSTELIETLAIF